MKKSLLFACSLVIASSSLLFADDALLKQAESGNAKAQFEVAELYTSGKLGQNTTENWAKAIEWLEKSAEQGYEKAQETLCIDYISVNNYEKALKWAKILADKGNSIGKSSLAFLLYVGGGVIPVDRSKAYSLIKETEKEPLSKALLGLYYISGWFDFEPNFDKAKSLAKEALEANLCFGYKVYLLALIREFVSSEGTKTDLLPLITEYSQKGLALFPESYDFKIYEAMRMILDESSILGVFNGMALLKEAELRGVKEVYPYLVMCERVAGNNDKAIDYLFKAAELGYTDIISQFFDSFNSIPNAFLICFYGTNSFAQLQMQKDYKKANEIAKIALNNNSHELIKVYYPLLRLAKDHKAFQKNLGEIYVESFDFDKYLKIAADNGCADMMFLYSKKPGLSKEEKNRYLIGAANMGSIDAMEALSLKYYKEKNDKAFYWADKAFKIKAKSSDYFNEDKSSLVKGFCYLDGICGAEKNIKDGLQHLSDYVYSGGELNYSVLLFEKFASLEENLDNIKETYFWANVALRNASLSDTALKNKINNYIEMTNKKLSKDEIESIKEKYNKFSQTYNENRKKIRKHNLYYYGEDFSQELDY